MITVKQKTILNPLRSNVPDYLVCNLSVLLDSLHVLEECAETNRISSENHRWSTHT